MKKVAYWGIAIGLVMLLSACQASTKTEPQVTGQPLDLVEISTGATDGEKETGNTEQVITKFLDMLGKTDAEAEVIMEGERNTAEDGTLIGRTYEVELFGEKVTVGSLFDTEQCVTILTAQFKNTDAEAYVESLTEIFGQPEEQMTADNEGGSYSVAWNVDNKAIQLYQSFELVSLELYLLPDAS